MTTSAVRWSIVVPVKRLATAKTRLVVEPQVRSALALAMALDTVAAAVACPRTAGVVVVSDDPEAVAHLRDVPVEVIADEPDAGLNPALLHGAREAARRRPGCAVATLSSDLPALRPDDLAAVLDAAAAHARACVADAAGTGTTLLAARSVDEFAPSFGQGSFARHVAAGAADLTGIAGASLRCDVDTLEDLRTAASVGCGPATRAVLAARADLLG